jgi:hypothetical protein
MTKKEKDWPAYFFLQTNGLSIDEKQWFVVFK